MDASKTVRTMPSKVSESGSVNNRVDAVYQSLCQLMDSGELGVGDRLPTENSLATQHGVSRPVVREAIARLAASGAVRTERGKGTFVEAGQVLRQMKLAPITSIDDLLAWQELRVAIEQEAARLAASRRSDVDMTELVRLLEKMRHEPEADGYGGEVDHAFHIAIATAAHNPAILDAQMALGTHIKGWISAVLNMEPANHAKRQQYRLSEHEAILDAIRARDPERAAQAMRNHIENGRTRFLTRISRLPADVETGETR